MTEQKRRPVGDEGVTIHSSHGTGREGVKIHSRHDGQSDPATKTESRVVGHEEFDKTKKLIEDES